MHSFFSLPLSIRVNKDGFRRVAVGVEKMVDGKPGKCADIFPKYSIWDHDEGKKTYGIMKGFILPD